MKEWNYTSIKGNQFHISTGCANPDGDFAMPWCQVDASTCTHRPFAASNHLSWDFCYAADDRITVDTGGILWPVLSREKLYHSHLS